MDTRTTAIRVNIGCGPTPTPGWLNLDNSLGVRLAGHPALVAALESLGLLNDGQRQLIEAARNRDIRWADAAKHIPLPDRSVEVLYTSHMAEHLDRSEVKMFLREARRVLAANGIIRVAVPDLKRLVDEYLAGGDTDSFVERTLLSRPERPRTLVGMIKYLVVGDRHHLWMYDGPSLCRLLSATGFREPRVLAPGSTMIPNPGELSLYERAEESVYVEAFNE